ncbi:Crp/Fnr family transcriptional regulator [Rubellimicrobium rubrum]|uniref:Crp/Fnr family transcriptional regulator n=1 Tax=Rubellimicrobium rubrum TaxID=2585369 RepID=A0A5C4N1V7_9RHOB|nr:Crp/Fnr family transcriptional regulator [Rubellimicrobium rubrum]TNC51814.1 Crp/Fnr family transcriptional regulator [Rubellimicrobium rubrum]
MAKLDESLIAALAPFQKLDRHQIREILDQAVPKRHDEGSEIFREGEEADRFFLLLDGFVRVVRTTPTGEQVILRHIPPGQLIGIAPALGRPTYPASALSASESLTLAWPVRLWAVFLERYPGFASHAMSAMGQRFQELHDHVTELATKAVEQRVAACVLRMVNQSGRKVEGGIEIAFPVTRANIAEMTGTTLHTVSRLLSAWERDGIVESRRKHIVVTAPHRLVILSGATG